MVRTCSRAGLLLIGAAKAIISDSVSPVFTMFVSPETLENISPPGAATSSIAEAYPSNGVEPYTYLWTQVSGDSMTISNPSNKSTKFSTSGSNGNIKSAVFQCEVTDDVAAVKTDTVTVNFIFLE